MVAPIHKTILVASILTLPVALTTVTASELEMTQPFDRLVEDLETDMPFMVEPDAPDEGAAPMGAATAPVSADLARTQPVWLLAGVDPVGDEASKDLDLFNGLEDALVGWGWNRLNIHKVSYYECDVDYDFSIDGYGSHAVENGGRSQSDNHDSEAWCWSGRDDPGDHDQETALQHVAYHLAEAIAARHPGQCIDIVAHSMSGLIARYMLDRVEANDPDYPSYVCVDDVVTWGTPHFGSPWFATGCSYFYQCVQMRINSNFITYLNNYGENPQGDGGTDWTVMGSTGDDIVPASYADMWHTTAHRIKYEENSMGHSCDSFTPVCWTNQNHNTITANADYREYELGEWVQTYSLPWPGRMTDFSLAYDEWGCGVQSSTSAWALKNDNPIVGEPFSSTGDCWYKLDLPSGADHLYATIDTPSGADRDIFVRKGSTTGTVVCQARTTGSSDTCRADYVAGATYYLHVDNWDNTDDPFDVEMYTRQSRLDQAAITSAPAAVEAGERVDVCWDVDGLGTISHTDVHWSKGGQSGTSSDQSGFAPDDFCGSFTAPSSTGTMYIEAHAVGYRNTVYSSSVSINVIEPHDDCFTGGDAGDSLSDATRIGLLAASCNGRMPSGDRDDFYETPYLFSGGTLTIVVQPAALADFDVCVYRPNGSQRGCSSSSQALPSSALAWSLDQSGYWAVRVHQQSGSGDYGMSITWT